MSVLMLYLADLYNIGLIDEIHLWDYCKNENDRKWLKTLPYTHFEPNRDVKWKSYYEHYYRNIDDKTILIKCDDDVVCIDKINFKGFLDFRIDNPHYFLVFPNIINNGVSAYFQQKLNDKIPESLMNLELPEGGFGGSLWESADLCRKLHDFFLSKPENFSYEGFHEISIGTRFSINLFAVMKDHVLMGFKDAGDDDEHHLSVEVPKKFNVKNAVYNKMYASHLSFFSQDKNLGDISDIISRYRDLYNGKTDNNIRLLLLCIVLTVVVGICILMYLHKM